MREMKKYHLAHHYKNFELGFGVTSMFYHHVCIAILNLSVRSQARYGTTFLIPSFLYKEYRR